MINRNIQVIDGADNCTFDIFTTDKESFAIIFPEEGQDIEFVEDLVARVGERRATEVLEAIWAQRKDKKSVVGIHGTLFFELSNRKCYYPTKNEAEMVVII
ncbi:hypothetical protein [Lysobacter auxotrophicus]|uniref:DUF1488 family protein n=1 Tax=Lysobacter auxotrophicus TaxID=2992573 RepID=A0ABN6UNP7_9GAMM|nr:hypothetical protein [Lysobacter auxotrophicus]BDU18017.1 hypothetical protein LA521A_32180 [Lysobacter auxotrophicus]